MDLTPEESDLLLEVLTSYWDEGPSGEGWQSEKLKALTEKVAKLVIAHDVGLKLVEKSWRCFHCNEIFDDYEKARKHFGNVPTALPRCIIDKCICFKCSCSMDECANRRYL